MINFILIVSNKKGIHFFAINTFFLYSGQNMQGVPQKCPKHFFGGFEPRLVTFNFNVVIFADIGHTQ